MLPFVAAQEANYTKPDKEGESNLEGKKGKNVAS